MNRIKALLGLFLLLTVVGRSIMQSNNVYYVHLTGGGVKAYPEELLATTPIISDDGTLSLTLIDGNKVSFSADEFTGYNNECPELPRIISFKFNNKYNPHLHQDVEATDEALQSDTIVLTLNAIGKRLIPSFMTDSDDAYVSVGNTRVFSKKTKLRFEDDLIFSIVAPGNMQLTKDSQGKLDYVPLGRKLFVRTNWLTDNPNGVPRIDIKIDGNANVTSKDTYLHAYFSIKGNGVYDDMEAQDVWIKGRGNTSWGWPKKPYRLKFNEKIKPFGLTSGKSWVLLSNYQTGSLFANALAFKSGQLVGAVACNHIVPVELYVNGSYQGNYMFTEKIGFGNNSVDADEEIGYMVELSVEYDGLYKYRSSPYNLPVNIKEPDFDNWTQNHRNERIAEIQTDFNHFANAIYDSTDEIEELLDVDACARFLFVNDLNMNREINHPKSTYLFKEDLNDIDSKIIFGPLWDFDWCYGYPGYYTYFDHMQDEEWVRSEWNLTGSQFFGDLKKLGIIQRYYYRVWTNFIEADGVKELQEFIQDYYDFAHVSFEHDSSRWGQNISYPTLVTKAQVWLQARANYVYNSLPVYDITDFDTAMDGDVNGDSEVTVTDAWLTFQYVMGETAVSLDLNRADLNYDKSLDMADVVCIVRRILSSRNNTASSVRLRKVASDIFLQVDNFDIGIGETVSVDVGLTSNCEENSCRALQFDVHLPDGLTLKSATLGECISGHALSMQELRPGVSRIIIIPNNTSNLLMVPCQRLLTLSVQADNPSPTGRRSLTLSGGRLTATNGEEKRLHGISVPFQETTGITTAAVSELSVRGGHALVITALKEQDIDVFSIGGTLIRHLHVQSGDNCVELPKGIYIVAGEKIVIY